MNALQGRTTAEVTKCASIYEAPSPVSVPQGIRRGETNVLVSTTMQYNSPIFSIFILSYLGAHETKI